MEIFIKVGSMIKGKDLVREDIYLLTEIDLRENLMVIREKEHNIFQVLVPLKVNMLKIKEKVKENLFGQTEIILKGCIKKDKGMVWDNLK